MKFKLKGRVKYKNKLIRLIVLCIVIFFSIVFCAKESKAAETYGEIYELDSNCIKRILPQTTLQDFKNALDDESVTVTTKEGKVLQNSEYIGSGMTANVNNNTYQLSVVGDLDGNGLISITDLSKLKLYVSSIGTLDETYKISADINNDGKITITDLTQLNLIVVRLKDIIAPKSFVPTVNTTKDTITVIATAEGDTGETITYALKLDDQSWLDNGTNGNYTYTGIDTQLAHRIRVKATDNSGNTKIAKTVILDGQSGAIEIIPSTTDWTNKNITVEVRYNSNIPNTKKMISINNGSTYVEYTSPVQIEHNTTVKAQIRNQVGEVISENSIEIANIDKIEPETFEITTIPGRRQITVNAHTEDGEATLQYGKSGIKEYEYLIIDGLWNWQEIKNDTQCIFNYLVPQVAYTIRVTAVDYAGNRREVTVQNVYTDSKYNLTIEPNGGTYPGETSFTGEIGTAVELQTPTKVGYRFKEWEKNGEGTVNGSRFVFGEGETTLVAKWETEEYTITYNLNGGSAANPTSYTIESGDIVLNNPERTGYTFLGWTGSNGDTAESEVTIPSGSTGNKEYTASWQANSYSINIDANGGEVEAPNITANYGETINLPTPTRSYTVSYDTNGGNEIFAETINYEFLGWYTKPNGGEKIEYTTMPVIPNGTMTIYAHWQEMGTYLTIPERTGYLFEGWYENSTFIGQKIESSAEYIPTKDTELYAKWRLEIYKIEYELNGGITYAVNPTEYSVESQDITLYNPTKQGYEFLGWVDEEEITPQGTAAIKQIVTIVTGTTGDKYYQAEWKPASGTEYKVIHKQEQLDGTFEVVEVEIKTGVTEEQITPATRDYEGFTSPSIQTAYIKADGSTQIVYEYTRNIYEYTLVAGEGTITTGSSGTGSYKYGEEIKLKLSSAVGYKNAKWISGNHELVVNPLQLDTVITMPAGNLTMTAVSEIEVYVITYVLDGGYAINQKTYTIKSDTINLEEPEKIGYEFLGWTGSNGDALEKQVEIPSGSYGDKIYSANWRINEYTLTFDTQGGTDVEDITTKYNTSIEMPATTKRNKISFNANGGEDVLPRTVIYEFTGWYTASTNGILRNYTKMPAKSESLYAQWDEVGIILPSTTKQGYTLDAWYEDANFMGIAHKAGTIYKTNQNITLNAKWEANTDTKYTVVHQLMELDGVSFETVKTEEKEGTTDSTVTPETRQYKGFTAPSTQTITITPDGKAKVIYKYERNKYNYVLGTSPGADTSGSTISGSYFYEEEIKLRLTALDGYEKAKWISQNPSLVGNQEANATITMPDGNLTMMPSVSIITYTINYDLKDGSLPGGSTNPTSYNVETTDITLVNPVKEGYEFLGWTGTGLSTETKNVTIPTGSTGDRNYTANWKRIEVTVEYKMDDGTSEYTTVFYGEIITIIKPTKEGYTFISWNDNPSLTGTEYVAGKNIALKQDLTLYPKWKANEYTVKYEYNGATSDNTVTINTVTYGNTYGTLPTPKREYVVTYVANNGSSNMTVTVKYTFDGWYKEETYQNKVTSSTVVKTAESHTLYAKWTEKSTTLPTLGTKVGHTFVGWYDNSYFTGTKYNQGQSIVVQKDTTFYAEWDPNIYGLVYKFNGATGGNLDGGKDITYGQPYGTLATPQKKYDIKYVLNDGTQNTEEAEYIFKGWYKEPTFNTQIVAANIVDIDTTNGSKVYLYAKWDGSNILLPTPTRYGYTFKGWYENSTLTGTSYNGGDNYTPVSNTTLYAKWEHNTSKLTINTNGGTYAGNTTMTEYVGTKITLINPTREGYIFNSWTKESGNGTLNGSSYTFETEDTTVKANWTVDSYTITYNLDGGTNNASNPLQYTVETDSFTLKAPTKTGYTFNGWTGSNGTKASTSVTIKKGSTGNKEYTATWKINQSKLIVDPAGGSVAITSPSNGTQKTITAKTSYTQNYATQLSYGIPTKANTTDTTTKYTVTYNANGGNTAKQTDTAVRTIVTKYTFNRWQRTNENGSMSTLTGAGTYTYPALDGAEDTITATYTTSIQSNTVSEISLPSATKAGSTFAGWYTSASGGSKIGNNGTAYKPSANITLYAHWIENESELTINPNGGSLTVTSQDGTKVVSSTKTYIQEYNTILTYSLPMKSDVTDTSTKYTVTYNSDGGNAVSAQTVTKTIVTGYTFSGWTKSNPFYGKLSNATGAGTYTFPENDAVQSTITANFTSNVKANTTDSVTLPTVTKTGATFKGWKSSADNKVYNAGTTYTPTANVTMTAQWETNKATLTINPAGGSVSINSTGGTKTISTTTSYTQDYGTTLSYGTPTKTSTTNTGYYTVTYNANGGSVSKSSDSAKRTDTTTYTFSGWTRSSSFYGTLSSTTGSGTYSFPSNSGVTSTITANYTSNTTAGQASVVLPTPTRDGYKFKGWYNNSSLTGTAYNGGTTLTVTGNMSLYAKWEEDIKVVELHYTFKGLNESNLSTSSINRAVGSTADSITYTHWNSDLIQIAYSGMKITFKNVNLDEGFYMDFVPTKNRSNSSYWGFYCSAAIIDTTNNCIDVQNLTGIKDVSIQFCADGSDFIKQAVISNVQNRKNNPTIKYVLVRDS